MKNLRFDFFDDSGLPRESRVLMFYSFETEERLARSGILHYNLGEKRFMGPRHDRELTALRSRAPAALPAVGAVRGSIWVFKGAAARGA